MQVSKGCTQRTRRDWPRASLFRSLVSLAHQLHVRDLLACGTYVVHPVVVEVVVVVMVVVVVVVVV
jgi:hypothetical protein